MSKIAFVQTGGTIDKDYPRKTGGYAFEIDQAAFERILERLSPGFEYDCYSFLKKDSQEITDADRKRLSQFIRELTHRRVIITHGTDTMIETAQQLDRNKNQVVVVTGAKLPERFYNSEAAINIGVAIGAVSTLQPGVFICMHGQIIPANQTIRNQESGRFYRSES